MGINTFYKSSMSSYDDVFEANSNEGIRQQIVDPNPKPDNYVIVKSEQIGNFLVILINYPNCTNYEGNKILVFENIGLKKLIEQKLIDPHFSENKDFKSPCARFEPTEIGWFYATKFAQTVKY